MTWYQHDIRTASKNSARQKFRGDLVGYCIVYMRKGSTYQRLAPRFYPNANMALRDEKRLKQTGATTFILPDTSAVDGEIYYLDLKRANTTLAAARKNVL